MWQTYASFTARGCLSVRLQTRFAGTPFLTWVLLSSIKFIEVEMTAKTSISLTDDQEAYARSLVESGQYPSLSAVLQRGLEMLRRDSEMQDAELQALRSLIDQRRAGPFVDIDVGEAETRAMVTRKRRKSETL
jgi:antitoxin ParD1/3/4